MKMKRHLQLSLLLLALIVTAASVAISNPQRIVQSLPPALNRLPEAKLVEVKDEAGQVILSGEFTTASDTAKELERVATLTGSGTAKGKAEIELVKSGASFSKQELEVALQGLATMGNFKLYVDGAEVIAFKANKGGKAAMKFTNKQK
jgi:Skp family chaperone for outer membrane proteins